MEQQISVNYNHKKQSLTILKGGKPVGGFVGKRATEMWRKIVCNNAKTVEKDGNVQVGL